MNSPQECGKILFDELKLPPRLKRRTTYPFKSKNISKVSYDTSAQYLNSISALHPLPSLITDHRALTVLLEKYIHNISKFSTFNSHFNMNRIHGVCMQTHSPTGRLNFKDPNLQTIPRKRSYKIDTGPLSVVLRDAFIPAKGFKFLAADYSQVEIR